LKLTVTQFRIVFILWTIWGAGVASAFLIGAFNSISRHSIRILGDPVLPAVTLSSALITLNLILFYVAHFHRKGNYTLLLRWVSVVIIPLYAFGVYGIGKKFDGNTISHHVFFILLHIIVSWKQEPYFKLRSTAYSS